MKQQTWASTKVKEAINNRRAKLFIYDEANPKHKKLFSYYKVKSYPTIIFLNKDELSKPLHRASGFVDATKMAKTINEKIKDE
jgi:thioredoxin-related protein